MNLQYRGAVPKRVEKSSAGRFVPLSTLTELIMLDIKFIRENADLIKEGARKKHVDVDIDKLLKLDGERRQLQQSVDDKRSRQNFVSEQIAQKQHQGERETLIEQMRDLKDMLQSEEQQLKRVMEEWQQLMVRVPNVPDISVPEGKDDSGNVEERSWGQTTRFAFPIKNHIELMERLDMLDLERGAKVAGFRGYFLKGMGLKLSFALWRYVYDQYAAKPDYEPMLAPSLLRREPFIGTGYLPQGEEDLYRTQDGDYLAGTSEVSVMAYYMDEVLDKAQLPIKFLAFSPCFRREAGSHGKDTKGLMRVHEFYKIEQIILCEANHQTSVRHHEELTENAEELMRQLRLPYHVVVNCGGDLGLGQVKKYDIEAWIPSERRYRETHSSSYFHDFQTRRLNIRYRDNDGTLRFVHSLNNTAIATPRILIALVENYQQEDGSIAVPEVLQPYLGLEVIRQSARG